LIQKKLSELEVSSGGRIGLSARNTANNRVIQYRAEERFPFCSTFKALLVASVLKKSMSDPHLLEERIKYGKKDIEASKYSPITEKNLNAGMSIAQLCEATIQYSDNAAANLLMKKLGGPQSVTDFLRSIGDSKFKLDRWEPELNSAIPEDSRDTSTPNAVEKSLRQVLLGDTLGQFQRELLKTWLKGNTTGDARIRAGVPTDWTVGDKTGTCSYGTTNDIGIIWPSHGEPIIVAIYFTQKEKDAAPKNEVIASIARMVIETLK
jgi:beta-lactamase class A